MQPDSPPRGAEIEDLEDATLLAELAERAEADAGQAQRRAEAAFGAAPTVDALGTYLREIGRYPLLTALQEVALAKRIEKGQRAKSRLKATALPPGATRRGLERARTDGEDAKRAMIQANLRLVVSIARRYAGTGMPLLDLIQEGNIGLIHTVDKFDWRRGFKFSTYATWWIRQAIQRGVADRGRAIRLPVHIHELVVRLRRARADLGRLGREPTDEELAEAALLPVTRVRELRGLNANVLSLETPVGDDGEATLGHFVPDQTAEGQYQEILEAVGLEEIDRVLSTLPEREHRILALRFGLTGEEPLTLEQIGQNFGLTRERIRQLEAKALARLRHPSRSLRLRMEES